jgi:hypothetical protein
VATQAHPVQDMHGTGIGGMRSASVRVSALLGALSLSLWSGRDMHGTGIGGMRSASVGGSALLGAACCRGAHPCVHRAQGKKGSAYPLRTLAECCIRGLYTRMAH